MNRNHLIGFLVPILSGLLLTLGFAPFEQPWAGWLALAPIAFYFAHQPASWKKAAVLGFAFGLTHFLTSLSWLTQVSWLGWFALSLYLALYPALWTIFWNGIQRRQISSYFSANLLVALSGSAFWVLTEYTRGWMFTGFPWNPLGVTQHALPPLIQIASIGGVWLVSGLVAFFNLAFALGVLRFFGERDRRVAQPLLLRSRPPAEILIAGVCVGFAFVCGIKKLDERVSPSVHTLRVLAVQPSIPQDPWNTAPIMRSLNTLQGLTAHALETMEEPPDLICWPETPITASVFIHPAFGEMAHGISQTASLLLGSNDFSPGISSRLFNAAVLMQKDSAQIYRKQHLVPFGEYLPFRGTFPFTLLEKLIPPGMDFSPGREPVIFEISRDAHDERDGKDDVVSFKSSAACDLIQNKDSFAEDSLKLQSTSQSEILISPLICFEDVFPSLARKAAKSNPDFFVNLTNDGWFGASAAARQHFHNALFRAVENRTPLLRVTNTGVTAFVDSRGVIQHQIPPYRSGVLIFDLPMETHPPTLYQRLGDWLVWAACLLTFLVFLKSPFDRKRGTLHGIG